MTRLGASAIVPFALSFAQGCTARNPLYQALIDSGAHEGGAYQDRAAETAAPETPAPETPAAEAGTPDAGGTDSAAPAGGLVAYWRLDEGAGTTCADSSGNGSDGTLEGGAIWRSDGFPAPKFANSHSLDFNGVDGIVIVGARASLANLQRFTVSAWIRPRTAGDGDLGRIVDKRQYVAGWQMYLCAQKMECPGGMRLAFRKTFSGAEGAWTTTVLIQADTWQHVAVVYDATSPGNDPLAYINGAAAPLTRAEPPSGQAVDDAVIPLTIGGSTMVKRAFNGAIDDVRIYSRALSPAEVAGLYAGNP